MNAECVFHSDRFQFDALVRNMRRAGILTRIRASVMAMTVCTCRKKASYRQPISECDVLAAAEQVISISTDDWSKLSAASRDLVTCSAHASGRLPMSSQARLTVVISQVLHGCDSTLLEEEMRGSMSGASKNVTSNNTNAAETSLETAVKTPKKQKLSMNRIKMLINKKKRRCQVKAKIDLPLFGGASAELFSLPEVGPRFCRLCVRHGCVAEIDGEATRLLMNAKKQKTVVKLWCASHDVLDRVKKELTAHALTTQSEMTQKWHLATAERKAARQYYYAQGLVADWREKKIADWKDILARDFEKKRTTKQRSSSQARKKPVKREDGSTYVGGHCLYCLMSFTQFKANGATGRCRHHPGYVINVNDDDGVRNQWTCCEQESETSHPAHRDHAESGCQEAVHSWRPHKRASRGVGQKSTPRPTFLDFTDLAARGRALCQF